MICRARRRVVRPSAVPITTDLLSSAITKPVYSFPESVTRAQMTYGPGIALLGLTIDSIEIADSQSGLHRSDQRQSRHPDRVRDDCGCSGQLWGGKNVAPLQRPHLSGVSPATQREWRDAALPLNSSTKRMQRWLVGVLNAEKLPGHISLQCLAT